MWWVNERMNRHQTLIYKRSRTDTTALLHLTSSAHKPHHQQQQQQQASSKHIYHQQQLTGLLQYINFLFVIRMIPLLLLLLLFLLSLVRVERCSWNEHHRLTAKHVPVGKVLSRNYLILSWNSHRNVLNHRTRSRCRCRCRSRCRCRCRS